LSRPGPGGFFAGAALTAASFAVSAPSQLQGQRWIELSDRGRLDFDAATLLTYRDYTDSLRNWLEEDPDVLYYPDYGPDVDGQQPANAWPWRATEVVTDSSAVVLMPGNLREAGRAYISYAVLRMEAVRMDPDVPCDELLERELVALNGFLDGWITARTLLGGPAFEPLDQWVFARDAGVLAGLALELGDRQLGGCLDELRESMPQEAEAYRRWRDTPSA